MKIDGGCHCGFIQYEAEVDPEKVVICHCTDCQTLSSSAYRTVAFAPEESFKLLSGEMKTYVKTADSGNKRAQTFCPECGTHIYAAAVEGEGSRTLGLRVGSIRQRAELHPRKQVFCRSALDWVMNLESVEQAQ